MKELIKFEFLKIFTSKLFIYTFIVFIIVDAIILQYSINLEEKNGIPYSAYKILNNEIKSLSEDEKKELIENEYNRIYALNIIDRIKNLSNNENENMRNDANSLKEENKELYEKYLIEYNSNPVFKYTGNLLKEYSFLEQIKLEFDLVNNYDGLRKEIFDKAENLETISIFKTSENDFSSKNISDIASKYKSMKPVEIDYQVSKGIKGFTKLSITDVLIILLVFVISSIIIFEEKENNLLLLIKSTKNGRLKTIISKICVMLLCIVIITLILFSINYIVYGVCVGYGNLNVSIQSVIDFEYSTLQTTVLQYLIIFILIKIITYFIIGLILLLVSLFAKTNSVIYIIFTLLFSLSYLLYTKVGIGTSLEVFKYLNIVNLIEVNEIFKTYFNIKIFNGMQNIMNLSLFLILILLVSTIVGVIYTFCNKRDVQVRKSYVFNKIKNLISLKSFLPLSNIFLNEVYKLLIQNRVLIIVIAFTIFQIYSLNNNIETISFKENIYKNYMEILSGRLTEEKEQFIQKESNKFERAENAISNIKELEYNGKISKIEAINISRPYEEILSTKEVFNKVLEKYDYIKNNPKAEFVYDTGYNEILRINQKAFFNSDILIIAMGIICFTSIFVMEYRTGMIKILNTTPNGNKVTSRAKIKAVIATTIIIFLVTMAYEIIQIKQIYGFSNLTSPINSLAYFSFLPHEISIITYLIVMYIYKLVAYICIVLVILWISLKIKNTTYSILITTSILLIPMILKLLGIEIFSAINISSIINLTYIISLNKLYIVLVAIVGIMVYKKICSSFN